MAARKLLKAMHQGQLDLVRRAIYSILYCIMMYYVICIQGNAT